MVSLVDDSIYGNCADIPFPRFYICSAWLRQPLYTVTTGCPRGGLTFAAYWPRTFPIRYIISTVRCTWDDIEGIHTRRAVVANGVIGVSARALAAEVGAVSSVTGVVGGTHPDHLGEMAPCMEVGWVVIPVVALKEDDLLVVHLFREEGSNVVVSGLVSDVLTVSTAVNAPVFAISVS